MITVVVVSDVRLYREGLAAAFGRRETISVAGTAATVAEASLHLRTHAPDVVIVDMAMRDSIDAVRALAAVSAAKVVAFGVDELESTIVSCIEAGVAGYIPCEASIDDLVATIEGVCREQPPCSPRVTAALFRRVAALAAASAAAPAGGTALSARERQILALIRDGLSNKEIAQRLVIEVTTVKNHVHSLLGKLGVATRAEAAAQHHAAGIRSRSNPGSGPH